MVDVGYDYEYSIVNKFVIIIKIMIMMMVTIIGLWMDVGMDQQGVRQTWRDLCRAGNVLNFQIPGHCQTVVGNIPYRISSALISKLLRQEPPLERIAASQNGMELDGVGRWEQLCFDSHVKCLFSKCLWHHPSGMLNRQVDSNCHPYNLLRQRGSEDVMKPYLGPIRCMYIIYMYTL